MILQCILCICVLTDIVHVKIYRMHVEGRGLHATATLLLHHHHLRVGFLAGRDAEPIVTQDEGHLCVIPENWCVMQQYSGTIRVSRNLLWVVPMKLVIDK